MEEKEVKGPKATAEDVKALIEARVKNAYKKAMATAQPEVAEVEQWWNLYSTGIFQNVQPGGPLAAHSVIKLGETAFAETVIALNPNPIVQPGNVSPCSILTGYDGIEVTYQIGNLTTWTQAVPPIVHNLALVPGTCTYVDVLQFTPQQVGMYVMHISARILAPGTQFAGFVRWVFDRDPEPPWGGPTPDWEWELPIKYLVYDDA